jgi:hypothetical protein
MSTIKPGGANDIRAPPNGAYEAFSCQLRAAIDIDRVWSVSLGIRLPLLAIEDIIGADIDQRNVEGLTGFDHVFGPQGIHAIGHLGVEFAAIHVGIGCGVDDAVWSVESEGREGLDAGEINVFSLDLDHLVVAGQDLYQVAAQQALGAGHRNAHRL